MVASGMHARGRGSRVSPHDGNGKQSSLRQRGDATAVPMQFDMYVMPTFEFLRLSELRPHEELLGEGKLVRADDSMYHIFYVSHEWTSSETPDHSMSQLYTFQTILLRMLRGVLPETAPTFADAIRLPKTAIASSQWQRLVKDSFVWWDFISVRSEQEYCGRVVVSFVNIAVSARMWCRKNRCPQRVGTVMRWRAVRSRRMSSGAATSLRSVPQLRLKTMMT